MVGCNPTLPPATLGGSFTLSTMFTAMGAQTAIPVPGVSVRAQFENDLPGAAGNPTTVTQTSGSNAVAVFLGSRAPATWRFSWLSPIPIPACGTLSVTGDISIAGASEVLDCFESDYIVNEPLVVTPGVINLVGSNRPTSITVSGAPTNAFQATGYGNPQTQYIDDDGTIGGVETAVTVLSVGTAISGPMPNPQTLQAGSYTGLAGNTGGNSTLAVVGAGSIRLIVIIPPCRPQQCPP